MMQSEAVQFKARHSLHAALEQKFAGSFNRFGRQHWPKFGEVGCFLAGVGRFRL